MRVHMSVTFHTNINTTSDPSHQLLILLIRITFHLLICERQLSTKLLSMSERMLTELGLTAHDVTDYASVIWHILMYILKYVLPHYCT